MPKDIINAVVSIEDERFYEHNGVDIKGLFTFTIRRTYFFSSYFIVISIVIITH